MHRLKRGFMFGSIMFGFSSSTGCSSLKATDVSSYGGALPRSPRPPARSTKRICNRLGGSRDSTSSRISSGAGISRGGENGTRHSPRASIDVAANQFSNSCRSSLSAQIVDRTRIGVDRSSSGLHICLKLYHIPIMLIYSLRNSGARFHADIKRAGRVSTVSQQC